METAEILIPGSEVPDLGEKPERDPLFADIFCDLKRAPNALRSRLAEIAGVAGVETRVTGSLILDLPGVNERALARALTLDGAFNNVVMRVAPGTDHRPVMAEIDRLLAPYGGLVAIDRRDHPSAKQVDDRIRVLNGFAGAFPAVFLSIAAFMTSAVLTLGSFDCSVHKSPN
jgi:hypothetical protein